MGSVNAAAAAMAAAGPGPTMVRGGIPQTKEPRSGDGVDGCGVLLRHHPGLPDSDHPDLIGGVIGSIVGSNIAILNPETAACGVGSASPPSGILLKIPDNT